MTKRKGSSAKIVSVDLTYLCISVFEIVASNDINSSNNDINNDYRNSK